MNPQICKEWAVSLACAGTTAVAVLAWFVLVEGGGGQDAFAARVWQWRQQQANKAKGIVAPPAIAPAGAATAQIPLAPLPPQAAAPVAAPPLTIPPTAAAPPTWTDIEAEAGRSNDNPRQASSDPMTSPASPPPSALPSWVQPSTMIGPLHEQIPGTAADSNVPSSPAAPPQAGAHTS
ncbi:hypothetical protein FS837_000443 [Tulasnella sp. UAMH 9824]|nr:hypothetical protein FS837_000443 [Tulasnella sp. UAMH 9824]